MTDFEKYKLIYNFMNRVVLDSSINSTNYNNPYNKDWNALMEVVNQIEERTAVQDEIVDVNILGGMYCTVLVSGFMEITESQETKILTVYESIIHFIKWYNDYIKEESAQARLKRNKSLVGISGKIGSGKSTVGQIIQYLTAVNTPSTMNAGKRYTLKEYLALNDMSCNDIYEIKKFASKLKDITCILIGCTREDLESQEFKTKELGEAWDMYELTWGDGWESHTDIVTKDFNKNLYLNDRGEFEGSTKVIKMTPRKLMQVLGTECIRNLIHPNAWVNSLFANYSDEFNWVIDDMRFNNEYEAIKTRGGILIRVERNLYKFHDKVFTMEELQAYHVKTFGYPLNRDYANENLLIAKNTHEGEVQLDNHEFDYTIQNDGNLDDLIYQVKDILKQEGLI